MSRTATVVGGGPAGLMAAEVLASAGFHVRVFDHMASFGRKFLLAGRGGLNITHSRPIDELLHRYGSQRAVLEPAIRGFDPDRLRAWCADLGETTFVGSSGRVFPGSFRATPLLRAWLRRLSAAGVGFESRHRWLGWCDDSSGRPDPTRSLFARSDGTTVEVVADVTVLALGGASWPRVGSDGGWVSVLRGAGITVTELRPANCGVEVGWSDEFVDRFAGVPLKNVAVGAGGAWVRGDAMITASGLEGGPVYDRSAAIRDTIVRDGSCTVVIDLQPDLSEAQVAERLARRRPKDTTTSWIRRAVGLSSASVSLLREVTENQIPTDPAELARLVKAAPLRVERTMSIDRAISTAGGIDFAELDDSFMLRRLPGVFVAGEMLDWEAPTGGYLLQAAFSTATASARGAAAWGDRAFDEIHDGHTRWRIDRRFMLSNWSCIWGRGCAGIGSERAPHLGHGCCSLGAELDGADEARNLAAMSAMLSPDEFEHHAEAAGDGIFRDDDRSATRVVDGACIFLNRPGFAGGAGCALHLAAVARDESPIDWKPSVCWQLPVKVDWEMSDDGVEVATVREWSRADWGEHGETMAWVCTEEPEAYVGDHPVVESLADELTAIVGHEVYVELRRRHR